VKHAALISVLAILALFLLSCSPGPAPAAVQEDSTIVFADGGYISRLLGSQGYINAVSGEGTGAITYTSSEPAIASVDAATGEVTALAKGVTYITASKAATETHTAATSAYTVEVCGIGSTYQGGKIAYFLAPANPGYDQDVPHGIIAAPADQGSAYWSLTAYKSTYVAGAVSMDIGKGLENSTAIIAQNGAGTGYAAGVCDAYVNAGYGDWFLPSLDELTTLYENRALIGGFASSGACTYWSSTSTAPSTARYKTFDGSGATGDAIKDGSYFVRPVRYF